MRLILEISSYLYAPKIGPMVNIRRIGVCMEVMAVTVNIRDIRRRLKRYVYLFLWKIFFDAVGAVKISELSTLMISQNASLMDLLHAN